MVKALVYLVFAALDRFLNNGAPFCGHCALLSKNVFCFIYFFPKINVTFPFVMNFGLFDFGPSVHCITFWKTFLKLEVSHMPALADYQETFLNRKQIPWSLTLLNPLTPMSDQDRISPYYIYTISCRQVMRIKKNINYGITNGSDTKFSKLT